MAHLIFRIPVWARMVLALLPGSVLAAPAIPGAETVGFPEDLKGTLLVEEMNCVACHAAGGTLADRSKKAPRLAEVGARLNPEWIRSFLLDPQAVKPGTLMPDVMANLTPSERTGAAEAITHFLLSQNSKAFTPEAPDVVAAKEGQRLFQARGCAACHAPRDSEAIEIPMAHSVPLGALEGKYSQQSLTAFLHAPLAVRPSGRMPDLRLPGREAEQIAQFLLQKTRVPGGLRYSLYRGQVWEGLSSENVTAEKSGQVADLDPARLGKLQQHSAVVYEGWLQVPAKGRHQFFLTMNGGSLVIDEQTVVQQPPSDRRGVMEFKAATDLDAGVHSIRLTYFHTGREPKLEFSMEAPGQARGPISAAQLSATKEPVAPFQPLHADPALAEQGREYFAKLGCANCHDDRKVEARPAIAWARLDSSRGCLGDAAGAWPKFDFSPAQRDSMRKALPVAAGIRLEPKQQIDKTLAALNCIACHERHGLGAPAPERRALFTGRQPSLGDQGRIPPPLTGVGAKLTPLWLSAVLLHGQRQRDYVDLAMPQFGEAQVAPLVELFGKVDALEKAPLPKVEQLLESKAAGYELVGGNGMGCIACHEFNGQKAGEISALDIARVPERLQRNWFELYLRQPSRFHPTVIMPGFWPEGKSVRPNILGGDSAQQIQAIWNYLADGERAKKPSGLSRQSNILRVGDTAEICRGRGPAAGFRGIGVGYPERVNLVFDAGEMALRMLWRGEFATVDLGSFSPRGTDPIALPPGIPFHRLATPDEVWPYKGKTNQAFPQDHGYEFHGYFLDAKRRPTFRYTYGEVSVEDYFEDVRGPDGQGFFRRTLRFRAPAPQEIFQFRAAAGKNVERIAENKFQLERLRVRLVTKNAATPRDGTPSELLIPLSLPKGETTLILEYSW